MKIELNKYEAANILLEDEFANWSRAAAYALVEYYESLEEELGESIDLDRVSIRCDWNQYDSATKALEYYGQLPTYYEKCFDDSEKGALEYFKERTTVIVFDGGLLIQQF
jgi:hypothetical protein